MLHCCGNLRHRASGVQWNRWYREPVDCSFPPYMCRELSVSESKLLLAPEFGKGKRDTGCLETCLSCRMCTTQHSVRAAAGSPTQVWGQSQHRSVLPMPLFDCSVHYIVWLEVPLRCAVEQILYFVIDQQQVKPCFSEPSKAFVSLCSSVLVLSTLCVKHWEKC